LTGVKICGLTRLEDARAALEAGADALGFVLANGSPRQVAPAQAYAIVRALRAEARPPFESVAVLGAYDADMARRALVDHDFDRAQMVGADEDAVAAIARALAELGPLAARTWGAIRVKDADSLVGAEALGGEALHLDAHRTHALGGTGQAFDWALAAPLARARRVVLAGGLRPDNVAGAVRLVQPWRVDVSSGIEDAPGVKNAGQMRAFVEAVRHVDG